MAFGGYNGSAQTAVAEAWDGTVWYTSPSMNNARDALMSAGTSTLGLGAGGYNSGVKNQTEEFTGVTSAAEASDISFD